MGKSFLILADTHVVLWLALDRSKLSKPAVAAIEQTRREGQGLAISAISLWEIAVAEIKGRISLKVSLETFLTSVEERFTVLALTGRVCALTKHLPSGYPRDPADRLIAATALERGIPLLTADTAIRHSKALPTIW